jgi:ADP-ribose pyrophosphatase YjhB (NUDIX family)
VSDPRLYPDRPFLAVSAGIVRDGHILLIERRRPPAAGFFTFPGGMVETGETLPEAVIREVREETGYDVEPVGLAGYREAILRDDTGRTARHAVILPFAVRLIGGTFRTNEEIGRTLWTHPEGLGDLPVTEGLADVMRTCLRLVTS